MAAEKRRVTEAQLREIRVNRAYKAVLGVEGYRSAAQQLVWEDMQARAHFLTPNNSPGSFDPNEGQINEGKRRHFLGTLARINAPDVAELPEPQTKEKTNE